MLNIAHRGASGTFPENTLSAFRAAIDAGADMCELDVQLTRDGAVVVIHDDTVDRTTDGKGEVAELTLEELKRLDAGAKFKGGAKLEGRADSYARRSVCRHQRQVRAEYRAQGGRRRAVRSRRSCRRATRSTIASCRASIGSI